MLYITREDIKTCNKQYFGMHPEVQIKFSSWKFVVLPDVNA